jgi:peptidoglycan-associated lipoprotein
MVGLVVVAGCKSRRFKGRPGADGGLNEAVQPEALGGDVPLNERFDEDMMRVAGVSFENVLFDYDSFQIKDSEVAKIESVAAYMRENAGVKLVNEGHCDERGSREYNMALGEHRALAVRAYLVGLGLDGARIQTRSLGEEAPLDPGHNEAAWSRNRRVEFQLFK